MEKKQNVLKIASFILIAFTAISIVISVYNLTAVIGQVNNMDSATQAALDEAIAQNADSGVTADMAVGVINGIAYVTLAVSVIFGLLKVIVGILGVKKSEIPGTDKFFKVWGIIFFIFGLLGILNTFSPLGVCNLLAGIVAPLLYIIFSKQNKLPKA